MALQPRLLDRVLRPLHRWVWLHPHRRGLKLCRFALTEARGSRDLARAAEITQDSVLRQLYIRHALDEQRHATLFVQRGRSVLANLPDGTATSTVEANAFTPGERGLDDLQVDRAGDESLLAFLHLSEKAAAQRFWVYRDVLRFDPATRDVFAEILSDETFHMNYTQAQLKRISPKRHGLRLWLARLSRLWKGYLRLASLFGNLMGSVILTLQYFLILPLFALAAKRAARRLPVGWTKARSGASLESQY